MAFLTNYVVPALVVGLLIFAAWQPALASTGTIDATNHYAWDDNGGWVNWDAANGNVQISDSALSGYIWSAVFGWINLSPVNGGVTNDGSGTLGGWAWGQNTGWISFSGVSIDANGIFHGTTAVQNVFGTMNFDCTNCKAVTSWRKASSGTNTTAQNGGGNGPIAGSLGQPQNPSAAQSTSSTSSANTLPPTLTPTSPPPKSQPTSKPPTSNSKRRTSITNPNSAPQSSALPSQPSQELTTEQNVAEPQLTSPASATIAPIHNEPVQAPASTCTSFFSCIVQAVVGFFTGIFGH